MTDTSATGSPDGDRVYQLLTGHGDALVAIDAVIARAQRSILIFDVDLKDRGYNTPIRHDALRAFLLASRGNRLQIALHNTQELEADCPRLINLLRQFPSAIQIHRTTGVARDASDPFLIADDAHFWRKPHHQHPRSVLSLGSATDAKPLIERFGEIWESSEPGISSSTLGL